MFAIKDMQMLSANHFLHMNFHFISDIWIEVTGYKGKRILHCKYFAILFCWCKNRSFHEFLDAKFWNLPGGLLIF